MSLSDRGTNLDGLWISDENVGDTNSTINFNSGFDATITSFSIDIATYISDLVFKAFDHNGSEFFSTSVVRTMGAMSDPGIYETVSFSVANGLSRFELLSSVNSVEGNTGIDNVIIVNSPVPEPATMLLFSLGLLGFAGVSRKQLVRKSL